MYRALLISLALHLAILISPGALLPGVGVASGRAVSLRAVLRTAELSSAGTAVVAGQDGSVTIGIPHASRKPSVLTRRLPKPSDLPDILPSTAAITPSSQKEDQGAPGDGLAATTLSGEGEREYRLNVAREARRFKGYPAVARTRGQQGTVLIAISMALDGRWPEIFLYRSSGYDELDSQAVAMMGQAVQIAPIPSALQGRGFRIVVPVEYRLAD